MTETTMITAPSNKPLVDQVRAWVVKQYVTRMVKSGGGFQLKARHNPAAPLYEFRAYAEGDPTGDVDPDAEAAAVVEAADRDAAANATSVRECYFAYNLYAFEGDAKQPFLMHSFQVFREAPTVDPLGGLPGAAGLPSASAVPTRDLLDAAHSHLENRETIDISKQALFLHGMKQVQRHHDLGHQRAEMREQLLHERLMVAEDRQQELQLYYKYMEVKEERDRELGHHFAKILEMFLTAYAVQSMQAEQERKARAEKDEADKKAKEAGPAAPATT